MATEYISKIALPNGKEYLIKDSEARSLIQQLASAGISFKISTQASDTPEGVVWEQESGDVVTGTLVASENIKSIYLVPYYSHASAETTIYYSEYIVITEDYGGSTGYVWEKLGDTNISLDSLGTLAYKDSASGTLNDYPSDVTANFTNGKANVSATYKPAGTVNSSFAGDSLTSTGNFTPEGTITSTLASTAKAEYSNNYSPEGTIASSFSGSALTSTGKFTPKGTISKPAITVTPTNTPKAASKLATAGSVTAGGAATFTQGNFSGGSFTQGQDTFVKPSLTTSVASETLTIAFSQGSFTQGTDSFTKATHGDDQFNGGSPTKVTLPTFSDVTLLTGVSASLNTAPAFTGTQGDISVTGTPAGSVTSTFTGTEAQIAGTASITGATITSTFKGSAGSVSVSGTPSGKVTSSLVGTSATITSTGTATGTVNASLTKGSKTVVVN